jgi:hypothetical protein
MAGMTRNEILRHPTCILVRVYESPDKSPILTRQKFRGCLEDSLLHNQIAVSLFVPDERSLFGTASPLGVFEKFALSYAHMAFNADGQMNSVRLNSPILGWLVIITQ